VEQQITRRRVIQIAGYTFVLPVLDACSGSSTGDFATAIQALGAEFADDLPLLQAAGLPVSSSAAGIIGSISSIAGAISSAATPTQGATTLQTIEQDINAVAPIIAPFAAGVPALGIAIAAIPAIEALVNIGVTLLTPAAQALAAKPAASASLAGSTTSLSPSQVALQQLLARHPRR
jgi:hypothetical protein